MKKLISATAAALLVARLFAGCGNGDVSSSSGPSDNAGGQMSSAVSEAVSELIPPIINSAASDVASALDSAVPDKDQSATSNSSMQ